MVAHGRLRTVDRLGEGACADRATLGAADEVEHLQSHRICQRSQGRGKDHRDLEVHRFQLLRGAGGRSGFEGRVEHKAILWPGRGEEAQYIDTCGYERAGIIVPQLPAVLFVCVRNAGRSQVAASCMRTLGQGRVEVPSAGSLPAESLNPVVVEAMAEVWIGIASASPKVLADAEVRRSDVVITMGCGDAFPFYLGRRYLD